MKLVRDLIPAIIIESGGDCEWRYTESKEEYRSLLAQKVFEELEEYMESDSHEEAVEEAGDLYEVISTLLSLRGISLEDAKEAACNKKGKRGGFQSGIVLKSFRRA